MRLLALAGFLLLFTTSLRADIVVEGVVNNDELLVYVLYEQDEETKLRICPSPVSKDSHRACPGVLSELAMTPSEYSLAYSEYTELRDCFEPEGLMPDYSRWHDNAYTKAFLADGGPLKQAVSAASLRGDPQAVFALIGAAVSITRLNSAFDYMDRTSVHTTEDSSVALGFVDAYLKSPYGSER